MAKPKKLYEFDPELPMIEKPRKKTKMRAPKMKIRKPTKR